MRIICNDFILKIKRTSDPLEDTTDDEKIVLKSKVDDDDKKSIKSSRSSKSSKSVKKEDSDNESEDIKTIKAKTKSKTKTVVKKEDSDSDEDISVLGMLTGSPASRFHSTTIHAA